MNYRHGFHAGNFADVVKHLALVSALLHLGKKDKPFCVIDTHAGRGLYDLTSREARRAGEAAAGIGCLSSLHETGVAALDGYLAAVRATGEGNYPGSPLIAASLLRARDRLIAIEKHPEEFAALQSTLARFTRAKAVEADGYARLMALLPPKERRGLVLIDPPFEEDNEFAQLAEAFAGANRRFATGVYMLWFPIKSPADADAFTGEIANAGAAKLLRIDVALNALRTDGKERLAAAGLLIVNPPFGLAEEMEDAARLVAPALDARISLKRLGAE